MWTDTNYNEISELCHEYSEPVFITKNGTGDLAVMSIEAYELLAGKLELYSLINEGLEQAKDGKIKPMKESIKSIRERLNVKVQRRITGLLRKAH